MARSRNIKPGFFINDSLAEVEPLGRLLFAGLWCLADRAGRLEDRPKRIKAEVLPYDDCNVDQLLARLASLGFIQRYEAMGELYIQITNFSKHQNPHKNEAPSTIPAPEQSMPEPTNPKPAPEHSGTSTVLAPDEHSTNRADSLILIPDSLFSDTCPSSGDAAAELMSPEGDCEAEPAEEDQQFGSESIPYGLAAQLRERILGNLPSARVPKADPRALHNWSKDMDLLIRRDRKAPTEIRAVIDWCQADQFWRGNILSAGALRRHWDKLVLQMQRAGTSRADPKKTAEASPYDNLW